MIPTIEVNNNRLVAWMDAAAPNVRAKLVEVLTPLARAVETDARSLAEAHIRFFGKKPLVYLYSIRGGVSVKNEKRVTGYIRSGSPLAHLLEYGFTISDMIIQADGKAMLFQLLGQATFQNQVHRHMTQVQAYPALGPAFEAHRSEIEAGLIKAGKDGVKVPA